jgi:membrane protease YdiL (CAAX protease family)
MHPTEFPMNSLDEAPPVYPSIRQSMGIVGIVIILAVACTPILSLGKWIGTEPATFVYYGSAFGLAFYIVHSIRRRKQGSSTYNFRLGSWPRVVPLGLGTIALLFGVVSPIGNLIPVPEALKEAMRTVVGSTGPFTFLYFVIAAPILEELIFRGIMLDGLLKRHTPFTAILVSSILFGLAHLNPWQFVTGFVLGCFFGWVYYRSGSVAACMLMHMSANFSGYVTRLLLAAHLLGDDAAGIGNSSGGASLRAMAVNGALLVVFIGSVIWLRRDFNNHRELVAGAVSEPVPPAA